MERFPNALILFVFVLSAALGKDLHMKEYYIEKDSPDRGFDFNSYENYNTSHKERFARHLEMEAVTDTIISHLYNVINSRNPRKANGLNLRKMMKDLKSRLKKYVHRKKPTKKTGNTKDKLKYSYV